MEASSNRNRAFGGSCRVCARAPAFRCDGTRRRHGKTGSAGEALGAGEELVEGKQKLPAFVVGQLVLNHAGESAGCRRGQERREPAGVAAVPGLPPGASTQK